MNKKEHMIINQKKYIELCNQGKTRREIADEIGITKRTIHKYQTTLGVSAKPDYDCSERIEKYKDLCSKGYSRKEISEILQVSIYTIDHYIKITGIHPKRIRRPKVNEHFFDVIDTEEKAYILGFIFADGYIDTTGRNLSIKINKKDIDILLKIKEAMDCGNEIGDFSTKNCVRLNVSSKYLTDVLAKYGVVKNKTKTLPFPVLPDNLYRHFFRGHCDGDGCVHKRQVTVVIGSDKFFLGYIEYLKSIFKKNISYSHYTKHNYYSVVFSRKDKDIVDWMYKDANIYLNRKYDSYIQNWLNYAEKRRTTDKKP